MQRATCGLDQLGILAHFQPPELLRKGAKRPFLTRTGDLRVAGRRNVAGQPLHSALGRRNHVETQGILAFFLTFLLILGVEIVETLSVLKSDLQAAY